MLKKLSVLFMVCVMLAMIFAMPVIAAAEGSGLRAELYDFSGYADKDIGNAIDKAVNDGADLFGISGKAGDVPVTVPNLAMYGNDLEWFYEEVMGEGVPADYFGLKIYGYLVPEQTGSYELQGNIDNAYRLWIDGELWFDCWKGGYWTDQSGVWPESVKAMPLEAGKVYEIYAEFVENWGGQQVLFECKIDGGDFKEFSDKVFYKTKEAATAASEAILNPPPPTEETPAETEAPAAPETPVGNEIAANDQTTVAQAAATNEDGSGSIPVILITVLIIAGAVVVIGVIIVIVVIAGKKSKK